jgi:hypothetical protein
MRRWVTGVLSWAGVPLLVAAASCDGTLSAPAPMSCATEAVPDLTFTDAFNVDTGDPGGVGASYGQAACSGEYLAEVDLTSPIFQGQDLFTAGRWSNTLPVDPCDEQVLLTTFVFDGTTWKVWDVVPYVAIPENPGCHDQAQSHLDPGSAQLGGTNVPAAGGFQRARMAVKAWSGSTPVPVSVFGVTN